MDRVTHLKGELPAWATRILRNVSGGGGAASEPEVGRKAEVKGQGSQGSPPALYASLVPSVGCPGEPAQPVLTVPGTRGWVLIPEPPPIPGLHSFLQESECFLTREMGYFSQYTAWVREEVSGAHTRSRPQSHGSSLTPCGTTHSPCSAPFPAGDALGLQDGAQTPKPCSLAGLCPLTLQQCFSEA